LAPREEGKPNVGAMMARNDVRFEYTDRGERVQWKWWRCMGMK
jgi:hypothetical protein